MSRFTWLACNAACSNWSKRERTEQEGGDPGRGVWSPVGRPVGSLLRLERAGAVNTGGKAEKEEPRKVSTE